MALVKCKECGADISGKAISCPKCGAKMPKRTSLLTWVIAFVAALWLMGYLTLVNEQAKHPAVAASRSDFLDNTPEVPVWIYRDQESAMAKGKELYASLRSANEFELKPPYAGRQRAVITLRHLPSDGDNALLEIQRGQFVCSFPSCAVQVRFDDGPAKTFKGSVPADYSHTALFLEPHAQLMQSIKTAKLMRVQAEIYQEGAPVLEFNVAGLDAKKLRP